MNNFEKLPAHELKAAGSLTKSDSEIKALGDASKLRAKKLSGRIRVTLGDLIVGDNDRPNLNLIKDGAHQIITITFLERQTRFIGTKLNTSLNKQTSWEAKRTAMPKGKNGAELRKTFQNLYSSNYPNTSNASTRSKASQPKALQEALDLNDSLRREENFVLKNPAKKSKAGAEDFGNLREAQINKASLKKPLKSYELTKPAKAKKFYNTQKNMACPNLNNKDCDGLRDEINHQPSKKSQNSLTINNRLRQHQQLIKSHQLNRQHSQQNFLSGSKSEGMINYSPVLTQDEKLNLTACNNNSSVRPSDNKHHNTTIKSKIRNSRLSLSDLSLTRQTQSVVSSYSNQHLTRKNTSNSTQYIESEEPQPSNQTTDPESIDNQSEFTAVSILSSQQMTVVNLQSNLQNSSSSSLPVSLRLPLSPTTRSRLTPKSKSTNTTKPTAIRPHTPDLTNSRPKSPSQINLANLAENWGGGGPSELSYGLPDPPSPISAFEINLSTQSNDSQSNVPCTINPRFESGVTVDPKPLPNYDLPQRTLTIQALPPSEHPESNRSNTPGQSWPENLPNHQLSSKLEIEHKDEDSEEEDTDDDF
ncbi:hypothetical protein BY996DRAFT_6620507 [Phakopsora pachyrhizi]|nr:hypothetical protein BY996DRAFT_6620507 [Phakopsora pachyrhizi]